MSRWSVDVMSSISPPLFPRLLLSLLSPRPRTICRKRRLCLACRHRGCQYFLRMDSRLSRLLARRLAHLRLPPRDPI